MASLYHHIETCLAHLGDAAFLPGFLDLVECLDMDQIMIFAIGDDRATCLVSRHFSRSALGGQLSAKYLDGWYRQDPLLPDLLATPPGEVRLRRMEDIAARMSDTYRRAFFDRPGLSGKTTLLAAGDRLRLFVNLYHSQPDAAPCDADLARLIGRLALTHFSHAAENALPSPLAALSAREREVCLGILSGQKAEAIAAQMHVAPSTVVTYRKRAYDKLGISSRAALFAICAR